MKGFSNYIMLLFFVLFTNCDFTKEKKLGINEYLKWTQDNPIQWSKGISNISLTLEYVPSGYKYLMDNRSLKNGYNQSGVDDYYQRCFFKLKIRSLDSNNSLLKYKLKNETEYQGRLEYFLNYIKDDIYILNGNDTTFCSDSHFERTYDLSRDLTILLSFDKKLENLGNKFVYNEHLFNLGKLNLQLKSDLLKSIPKLIIQ